MSVGSQNTRLIVLRGNSGSGKSTAAAEIRAQFGRGIALVGQDNLRRVVLGEKDVLGGANIYLIDSVARYALDHGFHVIIEGILYADRYAAMLDALRREHLGLSRFYYLDVPLAETIRRHAARPQAAEFSPADMARWYRQRDLLPGGIEQIIPMAYTLEDAVHLVMAEAGLPTSRRGLPLPPLAAAAPGALTAAEHAQ